MSAKAQPISIWFFIGVLLAIYGVLILGASIFSPADDRVVLSELRIGIWWGALMLVMGVVYALSFAPGRRKG